MHEEGFRFGAYPEQAAQNSDPGVHLQTGAVENVPRFLQGRGECTRKKDTSIRLRRERGDETRIREGALCRRRLREKRVRGGLCDLFEKTRMRPAIPAFPDGPFGLAEQREGGKGDVRPCRWEGAPVRQEGSVLRIHAGEGTLRGAEESECGVRQPSSSQGAWRHRN